MTSTTHRGRQSVCERSQAEHDDKARSARGILELLKQRHGLVRLVEQHGWSRASRGCQKIDDLEAECFVVAVDNEDFVAALPARRSAIGTQFVYQPKFSYRSPQERLRTGDAVNECLFLCEPIRTVEVSHLRGKSQLLKTLIELIVVSQEVPQ